MKKIVSVLISGMLLLLVFLSCYPIWFLVSGSLMSGMELKELLGFVLTESGGYAKAAFLPVYPTLRAYVELLLDSPFFFPMFWNSVKLAAGILAGQLLVGMPAAWGFAHYHFRGKKTLFRIYIVLMMMPFQVTMLSAYLVMNKLELMNTLQSVILLQAFATFPVFLMYRFFVSVPAAILEAAKIDGAGHLQTFIHIGIPLGAAGIVSVIVLSFLECWSLIEQPMTFLKDKSLWPLSLYLPEIGLNQAGSAFAASIISLIPALLVFISCQDFLEQGIAASAIK